MELTAVQSFALRPIDRPGSDGAAASELLRDGAAVGTVVEGAVLEAQYETDCGEILLFATDDSPYEEQLHIYLLDSDSQVQESLHIGQAYTPGILKDLRADPGDSVTFRFFSDGSFRLRLLDEPKRQWGSPRGVRSKPGAFAKRRLELKVG
ncbi:MAG: hypothetical protein GC160_04550 [Acidobacteria bacterium]|nr:hypothetical protein [Acidobacteriota bacterium]